MGSLRNHVTVHTESGLPVVFGPDDDVPAWAAEKITNPAAWQDGEPDEPPADESTPETEGAADDVAVPPRSGAGSSRAHWAKYARSLGVREQMNWSRDEIIAALESADLPVE